MDLFLPVLRKAVATNAAYIMNKVILIIVMALLSLSVNAAETDGNYRLGTGDKVFIQVFDENELTMETRLGSSGVINYSYLGALQVAGKTTLELEEQITRFLSDGYLLNPIVNVTVTEYRPFYINGEVSRPGDYPFQPGLTLQKAIALAGGLTDRASKRKMYLQKGEKIGAKKIKVSMDTSVSPGDIITIEEGFF